MSPLDVLTEHGWNRELRASVRSVEALARHVTLTDDERRACAHLAAHGGLPLTLTPAMLSLIDADDPADPIRRQLIPTTAEQAPDPFAVRDPLGEEGLEVVPRLVHRYPDRVLLLATDRCAAYCRFCTRKRIVGQGPPTTWEHIEAALAYIAAHEEVREVIVSGGDALLLDDERLETLLVRIRHIAHVDIIRLATRMLAFVPSRVTPGLVRLLAAHHPVYVLSHFNHPRELSDPAGEAVRRLVDAGIPVLNQTVLLRGVNDDEATLTALFRQLTHLRARPYYLHQVDVAPGTAHFRVPLARAQQLMANLRGHISGLCLPTLVIDVPGGKGKVPVYPSAERGRDEDSVTLEGFAGGTGKYPLG